MTTILGFSHNEVSYLIADSQITWGDTPLIKSEQTYKLITKYKNFIFAVSGSVSISNVISWQWEPPKIKKSETDEKYICGTVSKSLFDIFKETRMQGSDSPFNINGSITCIYKGKLFNAINTTWFSPVNGSTPMDNFISAGSGNTVARSVFYYKTIVNGFVCDNDESIVTSLKECLHVAINLDIYTGVLGALKCLKMGKDGTIYYL